MLKIKFWHSNAIAAVYIIVAFRCNLQVHCKFLAMSFQSIFYHWLPYIRESLNYKCHDVYHSPSFQSLKTHLSVFLTVLKKLWHPSNIKQRERGRERVSKKITFFTSWEFKTEGKANLACFKFLSFFVILINVVWSISFNGKNIFLFFA